MGDIVLAEGNNELNVQLIPIAPPGEATLSGVVTDAETGDPIPGVTVVIGTAYTFTDANGFYHFEGLSPGAYNVTFEKEEYETLIR